MSEFTRVIIITNSVGTSLAILLVLPRHQINGMPLKGEEVPEVRWQESIEFLRPKLGGSNRGARSPRARFLGNNPVKRLDNRSGELGDATRRTLY